MKRAAARLAAALGPGLCLAFAASAAAPPPSVAALFGLATLEPPIVAPRTGCEAQESPPGACPWLLRGLHELRLGHAAEAAADALRGLQATPDGVDSPEIAEALELLRAEGLARSGRETEAQARFAGLARNGDPSRRAVAALRLADLALDRGAADEAAAAYAQTLPAALEILGEGAAPWRLRAAEASLAAGDPAAARAWLEAARWAGAGDAALELRIADTLAAEGRLAEAAGAFRRVAASGIGGPAARTARLRLAALESSAADPPGDVVAAETAAPEAAVAAYASTLLARARLGRGDGQGALAALEGVPEDGLAPALATDFRSALAAALRRVVGVPTDAAGCLEALARGGGSLPSLARRAGADDVAAVAERCTRRLGLAAEGGASAASVPGPEAAAAWPALAAAERTAARARRALGAPGIPPTP